MYSGNTPSSTIETTKSTMFCIFENRRYNDVVVAKTYSRMPRAVLRPAAPIQSIPSINRRVLALSDGRYVGGKIQIADIDMAKLIMALTRKLQRQPIVSVTTWWQAMGMQHGVSPPILRYYQYGRTILQHYLTSLSSI